MNLQAKKSWFVLNGQIIALGAGIKGIQKLRLRQLLIIVC